MLILTHRPGGFRELTKHTTTMKGPSMRPKGPTPEYTRTHDYPVPGKPNWRILELCDNRACKRTSHLHWETILADGVPVQHHTHAAALERMEAQEAAKGKPEPVALAPYRRFTAILNDDRAVVLYSRMAPAIGQTIKQGKFTVEYAKELKDSRLQLGDHVLP